MLSKNELLYIYYIFQPQIIITYIWFIFINKQVLESKLIHFTYPFIIIKVLQMTSLYPQAKKKRSDLNRTQKFQNKVKILIAKLLHKIIFLNYFFSVCCTFASKFS